LLTILKKNRLLINFLSVAAMTSSDNLVSPDLKNLEEKLERLLTDYRSLKNENLSLKAKQEALVREKAKLLEKTALVKTRIEAMISRLKAMEQTQ
jgi:cell division protein ZapB